MLLMGKRGSVRTEKDFLGKVAVPSKAYYGSFTTRALQNFALSGQTASPSFMRAMGCIKHAAALTNNKLGVLDAKKAKAIVKSASEFSKGMYAPDYSLDVYQAGAGTPYNMNCNEILANRATELLGGKKGQYLVHPNNDVNMSQSSNDVIPTALRLALLFDIPQLLDELKATQQTLKKKAREFSSVLKTGRTHLQDAVPITLGQEFLAHAHALERSTTQMKHAQAQLYEIHLGGTAIGTGLNTHPRYKKTVVATLKQITKLPLKPTDDTIELTENMDSFVLVSNALKMVAIDLANISRDLIIMNSGPRAGIAEITLPEVEPGSSIMPGKVNPSILEATTMVCHTVVGNDTAITLSAMHTVLELNVMTPLILHKLTESISLLTNTLSMFRTKCVQHITANKERCKELLENSVCFATALNPYFGYDVVAYLIQDALKHDLTIKQVVVKHKLLTEKELNQLLSFKTIVRPQLINRTLLTQVQSNSHYKKILAKVQK